MGRKRQSAPLFLLPIRTAKAQEAGCLPGTPQLENNIKGWPWAPRTLCASMARLSHMVVANTRTLSVLSSAPSLLRTPSLLCKWGNWGSKWKELIPGPMLAFALWKGEDHLSPLHFPSHPKKELAWWAQVASCAACLLPPAMPSTPSPNFHVLEKGEGWSLKSAGEPVRRKRPRVGEAGSHALRMRMDRWLA